MAIQRREKHPRESSKKQGTGSREVGLDWTAQTTPVVPPALATDHDATDAGKKIPSLARCS